VSHSKSDENRYPRPDGEARQHGIIKSAECYAKLHCEHPTELRRWTECAPVEVRALFRTIRDNTASARVQDAAKPVPYRHDPALTRLEALATDLQELLSQSRSVWEQAER
jgi:hypothetical protein